MNIWQPQNSHDLQQKKACHYYAIPLPKQVAAFVEQLDMQTVGGHNFLQWMLTKANHLLLVAP